MFAKKEKLRSTKATTLDNNCAKRGRTVKKKKAGWLSTNLEV